MAANYNTIWLRSSDNRHTREFQAGVAINPGYLLELYDNSGVLSAKPHSKAGNKSARFFAMEQEYIAKGISTQYAIGDTVIAAAAQPGDEIYARVAASAAAITDGDLLESAGDGTLRKSTNIAAALTDSTGGAASTTFAAIAAGGAYAQADIVAIKNALSQIVLSLNILKNQGYNGAVAQAIESVNNSGGGTEVFIRTFLL